MAAFAVGKFIQLAAASTIEEKFSAQALENGFDQVVLPHRDAAGENQNVFAETLLDFCGKIIDAVESVFQGDRLPTG